MSTSLFWIHSKILGQGDSQDEKITFVLGVLPAPSLGLCSTRSLLSKALLLSPSLFRVALANFEATCTQTSCLSPACSPVKGSPPWNASGLPCSQPLFGSVPQESIIFKLCFTHCYIGSYGCSCTPTCSLETSSMLSFSLKLPLWLKCSQGENHRWGPQ